MTVRYAEIDAAIAYIHRHLDEPLSLSGLAAYVAYSPYHFTRLFKQRIGLSPQYYVSSLRLAKAKELLLRTSWNIRDIGLEIGQQSLGTFTTRFTERVGVTPAEFRQSAHRTDASLQALRQISDRSTSLPALECQGRVEGTISTDIPFSGITLIGLFARPIPEGMPLYGTLMFAMGAFYFHSVKPGTYYLMGTSVAWETGAVEVLLPYETLRTRSKEPIVVRAGERVSPLHVELYPPRLDDPPILISLPLLMANFHRRAGIAL